jgi:hypothetical protein
LLRADLGAERPPPLGDLVGAAIRDGRRIRRKRRLGIFGASAAVVAALASSVMLIGDAGVAARYEPAAVPPARAVLEATALPPQTVPIMPAAPTGRPRARTLTIHSGTARADGLQKKATSAAMLHLLTRLLPPGRATHYGVVSGDDLRVQLYLDDGNGPAMVRVALDKNPPGDGKDKVDRKPPVGDDSPRGRTVTVTIQHMPDNCLRSTAVDATWPDGTVVRVDVASCLPFDGVQSRPTRSALTADEAVRVATDPRWGMTMDEGLVTVGERQFPRLPVLSR